MLDTALFLLRSIFKIFRLVLRLMYHLIYSFICCFIKMLVPSLSKHMNLFLLIAYSTYVNFDLNRVILHRFAKIHFVEISLRRIS